MNQRIQDVASHFCATVDVRLLYARLTQTAQYFTSDPVHLLYRVCHTPRCAFVKECRSRPLFISQWSTGGAKMVNVRERQVQKKGFVSACRLCDKHGSGAGISRCKGRQVDRSFDNLKVFKQWQPVCAVEVRAAVGMVCGARPSRKRQSKKVIKTAVGGQKLMSMSETARDTPMPRKQGKNVWSTSVSSGVGCNALPLSDAPAIPPMQRTGLCQHASSGTFEQAA